MESRLSKIIYLSLTVTLTGLVNCPAAQAQIKHTTTIKSTKPGAPASKINTEPAMKDILSGKYGAAETKLRALLSEAEKNKDDKGILDTLDLLATSLEKQNRISDSEPLRLKALNHAQKAFGEKSVQHARELANMGSLSALKGENEAAWKYNDEALSILESAKGENHLEKAACYLAIARTRQTERSLGLADEFFRKALEETETALGADAVSTLLICQEYAAILEKLERKDEAKKLSDRVTVSKTLATTASSTTSGALPVINEKAGINKMIADAKKMDESGDVAKSIDTWKATIAAIEKEKIKDERLAYCLVQLANKLMENKSYSEAEAILKKGIEVRTALGSPQNLGLARNLRRLGEAYLMQKNYEDAKNVLVKAYETEEAANADAATRASTLQRLANACMLCKDFNKGENACRQLLVLVANDSSSHKDMKKMMATSMLGGMLMQSGRMAEGMKIIQDMASSGTPSAQASQEYVAAMTEEWKNVEKLADDAELKTIFH